MPFLKRLIFIIFLGVMGLRGTFPREGEPFRVFAMPSCHGCYLVEKASGDFEKNTNFQAFFQDVSSRDSFFVIPQVWNIPFTFPAFFREPYGSLILKESGQSKAEKPLKKEEKNLRVPGKAIPELSCAFLKGSGGTFFWERYPWLSPDLRERGRQEKDLMPSGGMVVILLDDVGNSVELARQFGNFSFPLTWAILPDVRGAQACGNLAEEKGIPYIIHMPMQALSDAPGSYWYKNSWIVEGMGLKAMEEKLDLALERLPKALGVNNHRGSLATADPFLMKPFMMFLRERGLFFLDSRTNSQSCAASIAVAEGMPLLQNNAFLDHREEKIFFRQALQGLFQRASEKGWAVGICHARPWTYRVLVSMEEALQGEERLKTLPQLVEFLRHKKSYIF